MRNSQFKARHFFDFKTSLPVILAFLLYLGLWLIIDIHIVSHCVLFNQKDRECKYSDEMHREQVKARWKSICWEQTNLNPVSQPTGYPFTTSFSYIIVDTRDFLKALIHTMDTASWTFSHSFTPQFQAMRSGLPQTLICFLHVIWIILGQLDLESRIDAAKALDSPHQEMIQELSVLLAKITKSLADATGSIPSYDQKQFEWVCNTYPKNNHRTADRFYSSWKV